MIDYAFLPDLKWLLTKSLQVPVSLSALKHSSHSSGRVRLSSLQLKVPLTVLELVLLAYNSVLAFLARPSDSASCRLPMKDAAAHHSLLIQQKLATNFMHRHIAPL